MRVPNRVVGVSVMMTCVLSMQAGSLLAAQASLGGEVGLSAGKYGFKVDASFGSDTFSNGVISYDVSITFGESDGWGLSAKENVVVGSGSYGNDEGLSASYTGNAAIGKNLDLSGTINSDGSVDGSITIKKPLPNGKTIDLEFDVSRKDDGTYEFKAKPGVGIELGSVEFKNGAVTYTFKGVIYDPNAPVNSVGDAVKRGLFDVWTSPGYAIAYTQVGLKNLWKSFFGDDKKGEQAGASSATRAESDSQTGSSPGNGSAEQVCKPGDDPDASGNVGDVSKKDEEDEDKGKKAADDSSSTVCKPGDDPFAEEPESSKEEKSEIVAPLSGKAKGDGKSRSVRRAAGSGGGNTSSKLW